MIFNWRWNLLVVIIAVTLTSHGFGQDYRVDDLEQDQLIELALHPTPEVTPALKYRLFPATDELYNRNAAIYYHRAAGAFSRTENNIRSNGRDGVKPDPNLPQSPYMLGDDEYQRWANGPLDEMPLDRVKHWLQAHHQVEIELRRACYSSFCDWGMPPEEEREQQFLLLIPEIQSMRSLARYLALKIRVEIVEKRYEDAITSMRYGFKLANDVGQSHYLVGSLVGIACSEIIRSEMVWYVQEPDSPNLFWAMTTLPNPVVTCRSALGREVAHLKSGGGFVLLTHPDKARRTVAEWNQVLDEYLEQVRQMLYSDKDEKVMQRFSILSSYPSARKRLLEQGYTEAELDKMPAIQACAIVQQQINVWMHDEYAKHLNTTSYPRLIAAAERIEELQQARFETGRAVIPMGDLLYPAMQQITVAEASNQRRLASIQVIEAIRLHLGGNDTLPGQLDELTVPVPENPEFETPFRYKSKGDTAQLLDFGTLRYRATAYTLKPTTAGE